MQPEVSLEKKPARPSRRWLIWLVVAGVIALVLILVAAIVAVMLVLDQKEGRRGAGQLARPIKLLPVTTEYAAPCKSGDFAAGKDVPGRCYQLGAGLTITDIELIEVRPGQDGQRVIHLKLNAADAPKLTSLTARISKEPAPRNQMAIVLTNQVVAAPQVMTTLAGGELEIAGASIARQADQLVEQVTG